MLFLTLWRECNFVKYYFISHDYFTTCAILRNVKYSIIVIMFLGFTLLTNFVVSARIVMILFTSAMQCAVHISNCNLCFKMKGSWHFLHSAVWQFSSAVYKYIIEIKKLNKTLFCCLLCEWYQYVFVLLLEFYFAFF